MKLGGRYVGEDLRRVGGREMIDRGEEDYDIVSICFIVSWILPRVVGREPQSIALIRSSCGHVSVGLS